MSRRRNETRLSDLVEAATKVFIDQGYRRTQMSDIAETLGVAKGTLYLYVESKKAHFDFVVRHVGDASSVAASQHLPVATPQRGATLSTDFRSRLVG